MKNEFSWDMFYKMPVIGIMRNFPDSKLGAVLKIFADSGLTNLEITMNSGNPAATIKQLRKDWGTHLNIGAGTVCTTKDLETALDAGAQFIVAPIVDKKVIKQCVAAGVPVFPGAYTPTEIYKAWKLGADMVKVFPASVLGPGFIKDVLEPLNKISLVPTGGVTVDNFTDFLKAGAKGVAMAGGLFPKEMIAEEKWDDLTALYRKLVANYQQFKTQNQ